MIAVLLLCAGVEDGHVLPAHPSRCQRHPVHGGPEGGAEGEGRQSAGRLQAGEQRAAGASLGVLHSEQGSLPHVQCLTSTQAMDTDISVVPSVCTLFQIIHKKRSDDKKQTHNGRDLGIDLSHTGRYYTAGVY